MANEQDPVYSAQESATEHAKILADIDTRTDKMDSEQLQAELSRSSVKRKDRKFNLKPRRANQRSQHAPTNYTGDMFDEESAMPTEGCEGCEAMMNSWADDQDARAVPHIEECNSPLQNPSILPTKRVTFPGYDSWQEEKDKRAAAAKAKRAEREKAKRAAAKADKPKKEKEVKLAVKGSDGKPKVVKPRKTAIGKGGMTVREVSQEEIEAIKSDAAAKRAEREGIRAKHIQAFHEARQGTNPENLEESGE